MAVKIVTDSTSDLSPEIAKELGITVIPLYVHFGNETYRDGINLTTDAFYQKLVQSATLPTTSAPSPGEFVEIFDKLAKETDQILTITVSSKLSATYESALKAKELSQSKARIEIINSLKIVSALGLIAISAGKAAKAGASIDEVINVVHSSMPRVDILMALDTLEYLRKGGRIGAAQALLGSVLKMNPVLTLKDGVVTPVTRVRSRAKAIDYLHDFATGFSQIEEIAVEDATTPNEAEALVERLSSKFPKEHIYRMKISPVIGVHVGPDVIGVSVLPKG